MAVRVKRYSTTANVEKDPHVIDASFDQKETTVDGYTFHWGLNYVRNFLDDGVGAAHAAFSSADTIVEDAKPTGSSRS